ncbi:MAG TPA: hypothetical protein VMB05_12035 [Solirubrobacteraceae bacterium]|nr:hypothetical protein [Solirubrobacteraceae bacterium]
MTALCALAPALTLIWGVAAASATEGTAAVSWGENLQGQFGTFYRTNSEALPIGVEELGNITSIATGGSIDLMLLENGTVRAAGDDQEGQLGDGEWEATWERGLNHVTVSEASGPLTNVKQVAAGNAHAMALLENGTVKTWGTNQNGNLGNGTSGFEYAAEEEQHRPKTVTDLQEEPVEVVGIASGAGSDFALMSDETLRAWGGDEEGELGIDLKGCKKTKPEAEAEVCESLGFLCHGEIIELCSPHPLPVMDGAHELEEVVEVAAGGNASYARLKTGEVKSWGVNLKGQLGTGESTKNSRLSPPKLVKMGGETLTNVKALAAGYNHALAIREGTEGREVVGWGSNEKGQLGKWPAEGEECAHNPCYTTAVPIPGLPSGEPEAIAAGNGFSLVLINHKVWAVGSNSNGALGNGETKGPEDCRTAEEVEAKVESKWCDRTPAMITMPGPVRKIGAQGWHSTALLETTTPPEPQITRTAGKESLTFSWSAAYTLEAQKLSYRPFERPEFEGEASGTGVPPENGAPFNTVRPHASPQLDAEVGDTVKVSGKTGTWTGEPAPTLAIKWQRCAAAAEPQCNDISGATGETYTITNSDLGDTIRVKVTGTNEHGSATAYSPPTEEVKPEGSTKQTNAENVSIKGKSTLTFNKYEGAKLSSRRPYEVKVNIGAIPRTTVIWPLP